MIYHGSCHCKSITFQIEAPEDIEVEDCNCSICEKTGFLHLILPISRFRLLSGEDQIQIYRFNTKVAEHNFRKVCGVKPFYIPRSNPDGIDVNVRCLDTKPKSMKIIPFDGKNWQQNAASLAHKSKE